MEGFYYVYVLLSEKDGKKYVGFTQNLEQRFEQHNKGFVFSTKNRRPLQMIYFEGCSCKDDATQREKYLKTHFGKMFIKNRLKFYLTG
ncbi:MAG: GIY-YIG nuclease family protein [Bacteroidales bacterium]|nr:GIY-YIG nuclease family protein [Bacteroidales bacterium]